MSKIGSLYCLILILAGCSQNDERLANGSASETIIGRVVHSETGKPAAYTQIQVFKKSKSLFGRASDPFINTSTDENGNFKICRIDTLVQIVGHFGSKAFVLPSVQPGTTGIIGNLEKPDTLKLSLEYINLENSCTYPDWLCGSLTEFKSAYVLEGNDSTWIDSNYVQKKPLSKSKTYYVDLSFKENDFHRDSRQFLSDGQTLLNLYDSIAVQLPKKSGIQGSTFIFIW